VAGDSTLFRQAALDRLASTDRLDERLSLPAYPRPLVAAVAGLLAAVVAFTTWLLLKA
jgi:hypothetical protein